MPLCRIATADEGATQRLYNETALLVSNTIANEYEYDH